MIEKEKKAETKLVEAKVIQIPVQLGEAIELSDGRQTDLTGLIVEIYNEFQKLKKTLAG